MDPQGRAWAKPIGSGQGRQFEVCRMLHPPLLHRANPQGEQHLAKPDPCQMPWRYLTEQFLVTVSGSYNDTKIKDPTLAVSGCGGGCTVTNTPNGAGKFLIDGNPLPNAPKWVGNVTARYGIPRWPMAASCMSIRTGPIAARSTSTRSSPPAALTSTT
jgi:hypothetical protein